VLVPLAVFGAVGAVVYYQTTSADSTPDVVYRTPSAPRLTAGPSEQLFRIDPTRSSVTYDVAEQLVGFDASHAKGSTRGVAGDIALNSASPSASRLGTIVVNVEQLNYDLLAPVHVTAGQTIRMACSWDRKNEPRRTQKYVIFAEGTEDEMCFSTYAIVPDT
jgi:hypothetical protein